MTDDKPRHLRVVSKGERADLTPQQVENSKQQNFLASCGQAGMDVSPYTKFLEADNSNTLFDFDIQLLTEYQSGSLSLERQAELQRRLYVNADIIGLCLTCTDLLRLARTKGLRGIVKQETQLDIAEEEGLTDKEKLALGRVLDSYCDDAPSVDLNNPEAIEQLKQEMQRSGTIQAEAVVLSLQKARDSRQDN